jgi:hypothetical protein
MAAECVARVLAESARGGVRMWWALGRWETLLGASSVGLGTTVGLLLRGAHLPLQQADANVSFSTVALVGLVFGALATPIAVLFRSTEAKNAALVGAKDQQIASQEAHIMALNARLEQAQSAMSGKDSATLELVTGLIRTTEAGLARMAEAIQANTRVTEDRNRAASAEHQRLEANLVQQTTILGDLLAGSAVLDAVRQRGAKAPRGGE